MHRRRFLAVLVLIAGVGLTWRVVYVMTVTRHEKQVFFDQIYYANSAQRLSQGEGFKTPFLFGPPKQQNAEHPPLTALVLTPVAWSTKAPFLWMRLVMAALGTGVVVLIGLLGREIAGARAGLMAATIAAVYPNLWVNDGLVMSETLAALTAVAVILLTYRLLRRPTATAAVVVGMACGLAMLSRGELALLVPLLVLPAVALLRAVPPARRFRLAAIVVLAASAVVAPWVAHNLARFEKPVLLSYGDAGVLLGANCDRTYAGPLIGSWEGRCAFRFKPGEPSVEAARKRHLAFQYMGDHVGRLPIVAATRIGRMWSLYRPFQMADLAVGEGRPKWVSLSGTVMGWALLGFAIHGVVKLWRRGTALVPLVAPCVIVTLVAAVFYGLVRFRAPAEPSVIVLAAVSLDALFPRAFHERRSDRGAAATSGSRATLPGATPSPAVQESMRRTTGAGRGGAGTSPVGHPM